MTQKNLEAVALEIKGSGAPDDMKMFAAMVVIRAANTAGERIKRDWFLTLCGF